MRWMRRGKLSGCIRAETRSEEESYEEQPDQILHGIVGLVNSSLLLELRRNGKLENDLHCLLGDHVGRLGVVAKNHVCIPLGGIDDARRIRHAGARGGFLGELQ